MAQFSCPDEHSAQIKYAQQLYADGGKTVAEITALLDVSRKTVYRVLGSEPRERLQRAERLAGPTEHESLATP